MVEFMSFLGAGPGYQDLKYSVSRTECIIINKFPWFATASTALIGKTVDDAPFWACSQAGWLNQLPKLVYSPALLDAEFTAL